VSWAPGATGETLRARARLLTSIRDFFHSRDVLEVETPLLCSSAVTDPAIESLRVSGGVSLPMPRYLQTSPEYAMKRLLAADVGAIFQIARAFRDGEAGARHNPEFSLLEWYRPGFDHHQLMTEVAQLLCHCLGDQPVQRFTYREIFEQYLNIDPFTASLSSLESLAREEVDVAFSSSDRDLWLDLLMSHLIEPRLAELGMCFIHDYPASQAALSRIVRVEGVEVGQRFELYVNGMELANGYCELTDPMEQRARFEADNRQRRAQNQSEHAIDELLLEAMQHGLPSCSGVALGVDRLLMLVTGMPDIQKVLAFDWSRS
jgi:elongation factor P--(R)-beta-lysine ligase